MVNCSLDISNGCRTGQRLRQIPRFFSPSRRLLKMGPHLRPSCKMFLYIVTVRLPVQSVLTSSCIQKSNRSTGNLNKQPSAGSLPGSPRSSPRPSITITQPVNGRFISFRVLFFLFGVNCARLARKQANPGGVTAPPSSLASNLSVNSPVSQSSTPNLLQGILDSASGSSTPNKSNDAGAICHRK